MRKLYNHTKGKIHPSPPPPTTPYPHLSLLPLAIATLAATLPPQDQQVLAYLLSISVTTTTGKPSTKSAGKPTTGSDHPPQFNCNCFRCYTSFWVRWDASPNRKVIHEIIDAYEDGLVHNKKNSRNKRERKNNKCLSSSSSSSSSSCSSSSSGLHVPPAAAGNTGCEPLKMEQSSIDGEDEAVSGTSEKGSVRKIVNFIGERIWVFGVFDFCTSFSIITRNLLPVFVNPQKKRHLIRLFGYTRNIVLFAIIVLVVQSQTLPKAVFL